uniref:RING-type domain-containing protein n=1 Tax=Chromera velia CCMP2878 TaxID=1169474 RepID=A0A0G4F9H7_9ALVE|mmetsp:Transcript_10900/g.21089  ORF Transcript_10900/g.21089 Transcript_10900/m.21089 type:complete len:390 (-) Transcript_10900:68-1237(-)|eukprot:Cvel_15897.t1-p1 / transcript=Cvel_15897.t1 / gene=Cvel_15897 / organism=Chromera_velia_CCMP2878 / gene_product=RING finger protein DG17, putative / transcript_product=RING finger protein DG17, putative / location=Cvel_scaffold1201:5265-9230(-) / protein_length=389 / sequence_SO=supercontig / SO=protein_coding / is_pseudo=false
MSDEIRRLGLDASLAAPGNKQQAENALCAICHDYIEDPKEVTCDARHVFCGPCIQKEYDRRRNDGRTQRCPTCRGSFKKLQRPQPQLRNFIEQVEWKCLNHEEGCGFTGTKKQLEEHLDEECQEQETDCPFRGCRSIMRRGSLAAHTQKCRYRLIPCDFCDEPVRFGTKTAHMKICQEVPVSCPNRCGAKPLRGDVGEHKQTECVEQMVDCPISGCGDRMKRKQLEEHEDENLKKHVKLLHERMDAMDASDFAEGTVRLPNFEAKAARISKGEKLTSASFDFKERHFCLSLYPKGAEDSDDGMAALYLRRRDEFRRPLTFNVEVLNSKGIKAVFFPDFRECRGYGRPNFCSFEKLRSAARATPGGALEFRVSLSAPKANEGPFTVSGYL